MARNEEKAQSMLYRFREAQAAELNQAFKAPRRPKDVTTVDTIGECDKWKREVMTIIVRKISKIQDPNLSDHQIRDLNDYINELMKEKYRWERRIHELGGANYSKATSMIDKEGKEVPGSRGYKYFGRAKDLPGVRELFERESRSEPTGRSAAEIRKNIDADYFGYRDEDDGKLVEYEQEAEEKLITAIQG